MATFTPNYNLEKPTGAEKYYISKFNQNADKIDTALKTQADAISTNKTQEETDIDDLRDELKEYTDNKVSAHNSSTDTNLHPYIKQQIADALQEAKNYTYSQEVIDEAIADSIDTHNSQEDAHQDIRDLIDNMSDTTQTAIENAISLHNVDTTAHQDIRTDAENYTDTAIEEHDEDPNAHGGKQVVYTRLTANGDDYISSMSYLDIQTAFSDGQNVSALLNNGGEIPIEVTIDSITAKRIVVDGNNLTLETYTMDSTTNLFTKSTTDYRLSQAAATVGTAVVGEAVVGGEESGGGSSSGGGGVFDVEFTVTEDGNNTTVTSSRTFEEIANAISSTSPTMIKAIANASWSGSVYYEVYNLSEYNLNTGGYIMFEHNIIGASGITNKQISVCDDDTAVIDTADYQPS